MIQTRTWITAPISAFGTRAVFGHELRKNVQEIGSRQRVFFSYIKNTAGDCPGQTHSQQEEHARNIQMRSGALVERAGGSTQCLNSTAEITCCCLQHSPYPQKLLNLIVFLGDVFVCFFYIYDSSFSSGSLGHFTTLCTLSVNYITPSGISSTWDCTLPFHCHFTFSKTTSVKSCSALHLRFFHLTNIMWCAFCV